MPSTPVFPDVGVIAPSSKVPAVEFGLGLERIRELGGKVHVHPQTKAGHWFFAGSDEVRARAFFDFARDPRFGVLWVARGGYGAARLLPLLDAMTREQGLPGRKLLVGYSDATALLDYTRRKWNWTGLHAPMPGLKKFCRISAREWTAITDLIRGRRAEQPYGAGRLRFVGEAPSAAIRAPMAGGNLCVWASLLGTPYQGEVDGKMVFFEEVDEAAYRIDRMVMQLLQSGALRGARAIVLGNFERCNDVVGRALKRSPKTPRERDRMIDAPKDSDLGLIRKVLPADRLIREIFGQLGADLGIPVAYGLPVGHGPGHSPLPLGGEYELSPEGVLKCLAWEGFL